MSNCMIGQFYADRVRPYVGWYVLRNNGDGTATITNERPLTEYQAKLRARYKNMFRRATPPSGEGRE